MKLKLKLGLVDSFCNPCCDIMFYFLLCCSCWASCDWFCQRENSIWTKRIETKAMDWQASDSHASYGRYFSHFLRIQDRFYSFFLLFHLTVYWICYILFVTPSSFVANPIHIHFGPLKQNNRKKIYPTKETLLKLYMKKEHIKTKILMKAKKRERRKGYFFASAVWACSGVCVCWCSSCWVQNHAICTQYEACIIACTTTILVFSAFVMGFFGITDCT